MFYDRAKKWVATGLALAVLSKEKAESMVNEWVRQGDLTPDEGKELIGDWVKQVDTEKEEIRGRIQKELHKLVEGAGAAAQEDFAKLEQRLDGLEQRIERLEQANAADEEPEAAPEPQPKSKGKS